MNKYPHKKVIILFTLTPLIGSQFLFFWMSLDLFNNISKLFFLDILKIILILPIQFLIFCLLGELIFLLPSFVFSLIYSYLKLTRKLLSFFVVGIVVFLGLEIIFLLLVNWDESLSNYETNKRIFSFVIPVAVISSLIMAWFALPKPEDLEDE
jgi:hypothetical protein